MEKTTKTTTSNVNVYFRKRIEGNKDGYKVTRVTDEYAKHAKKTMEVVIEKLRAMGAPTPVDSVKMPKYGSGDGDIESGYRNKVTAELKLSYSQILKNGRKEAGIDFQYMVASEEKDNKVDALGIKGTFTIGLSQYNVTKKEWSCGKKKYRMSMTYQMGKGTPVVYPFYYNAISNARGEWLDVKKDDSSSWVNSLKFKIDGKGNDLTSEGNIGFEIVGYIPITVIRTVTVTEINKFEENKNGILRKDNNAKTFEELLANRPKLDLHDGYTYELKEEREDTEVGAWVCSDREKKEIVKNFLLTEDPDLEIYPGMIIKVNENLLQSNPDKIIVPQEYRKKLCYASKLEDKSGASLGNFTPDMKTFNKEIKALAEATRIKAIQENKKISSEVSSTCSTDEKRKGFYAGCSLGNLSFGKATLNGSFETGLGAGRSWKTKVVELRQTLYRVYLNDNQSSHTDIFESNLDIEQFKSKLGHYTPAIISEVSYGKVVYLIFKSKDDSTFNLNLGDKGFIGVSNNNCEIKLYKFGGSDSGNVASLDVDQANKLYSEFGKTVTPEDVEAAAPISFMVSQLDDLSQKVKYTKERYTQTYIDKIKIRLIDKNGGSTVRGHLKCLDVIQTLDNKQEYKFRETSIDAKTAKEQCYLSVSPWAVCIEADVNIKNARDKYDYNIFIPYIPLDDIKERDEEGCWVFDIVVDGETLFNANSHTCTEPKMAGTYVSFDKNIKFFPSRNNYSGWNEQEILAHFFEFCEKRHHGYENFKLIGENRKKILISRD